MARSKKQLILAVDFDGTIVHEAYPGIGSLRPGAKRVINRLHADGHYIIVWTCRNKHFKTQARKFLEANGINFHKLNEQKPEVSAKYGETRKISADLYLDDKGIAGLPHWDEIYKIIKQKLRT